MAHNRRPSIRRASRRRARQLHRSEEVERRARERLPHLRERASDRRAVTNELRRRFFGL